MSSLRVLSLHISFPLGNLFVLLELSILRIYLERSFKKCETGVSCCINSSMCGKKEKMFKVSRILFKPFFCLWFSGNSFQFDIFTYTCYSVDSFHLYVLFVLCFLCSLSIPLHTAATANLFTVSFQSFFYFANVCLV